MPVLTVLKLYTAFVLLVFLAACLAERSYRYKRARVFMEMLILTIILMIAELHVMHFLDPAPGQTDLAAARLSYIVMIAVYFSLTAAFFRYVVLLIADEQGVRIQHNLVVYMICLIFGVLWCASGWTGAFVRLQPGAVSKGPLYYLGISGTLLVCGYAVYSILKRFRRLGAFRSLLIVAVPVIPILVMLFDFPLPSVFNLSLAFSFALLLLYNFNFWRQRYELHQQETKMAEYRTAVMMSQIGPHFIYNVLNTVYYLCDSDPKLAQKAIGDFSDYLRANLNAVEHTRLIPASQELNHVRHYLNLEKLRFGDNLRIELDLATEDFSLPPLTIQPLVENAVKHGVMKKDGGGTVRLITRPGPECTRVIVEDDGVGFDPQKPLDDKDAHIGLRSTRDRLWHLCRATMTIDSVIGRGTTVTVEIPTHSGSSGN